jgi:hypothetical protein
MHFTFIAKLVGSDGQIVSRGFGDIPDAVTWVEGDGLAHLGGEAARGEIHSEGRRVVWAKSNLRTKSGSHCQTIA